MQIKDKTILITGGLGGFGLPLSRALKDLGARVIVFDLKTTDEFECFCVDTAREEDVNEALSCIDTVDVLIHCAGEIYSEPFINMTSKTDKKHSRANWDRVLRNNLTSTFNINVHVCEKMVTQRTQGLIINFSSIAAQGNKGQIAYSAAKAGIEAMTRVIAKELGILKVRVVSIAPGFIDTPSTAQALSESALTHVVQETPLRKLGNVDDIIETVKYIIACDHLTGCTVSVDGGLVL